MTLDNDGALLSTASLPLPPANKVAFDAFLKRQTAAGGEVTQGYDTLVRYELENTAVSRPRSIGYVAFEEIMNRTFSDVRNGAPAGPALQSAQAALSRALSRMQ
jgi:multiple sugar transport system substrate-binding protein